MTTDVDDPGVGQQTQDEVGLRQRLTLAVLQADDLNATLAAVLEGVCTTTGWVCGQAWLPDVDDTTLACGPAWYACAEHAAALSEIRQNVEPAIDQARRAWSTKQPVWSDTSALTAHLPHGAYAHDVRFTAAVAVPVLAESEVVAVLHWFVVDTPRCDQRSLALVSAVAAQLGTALQRKRAEDELRHSEARYRAIVDSAADAIITITADGTGRAISDLRIAAGHSLFQEAGDSDELSRFPEISSCNPGRSAPVYTVGERTWDA